MKSQSPAGRSAGKRAVTLFVYKCNNDSAAGNAAYGDWEKVFGSKGETSWGGEWSTDKPSHKRIVREVMQVGDLVLAWQTDRKGAIGLCEVTRLDASPMGRLIYLRPLERFSTPVRLHELKKTSHPNLRNVSALKQGNAGTFYETTKQEAKWVLQACSSKFTTVFG